MDNYLDLMRARREQILERFYAALDRAGRPHDAASLIAVSKTVGVDETVAAIQAGYRHFAENRPQELVRKLTGLAEHPELPEVRFDMIGNLQTNKINAVLGSAELIHSVGSLHLAQAITPTVHYSGSPIPLSFDEAKQQKEVLLVEFDGGGLHQITALPVPRFQPLLSLRGSLSELPAAITEAAGTSPPYMP